MDFERSAVAFRKAVAARGTVGPRLRYTDELRAGAVAYTRKRLVAGGTLTAASRELGVAPNTLQAWLAVEQPSPAFRSVEIAEDATRSALVVYGPCGLRIEGLDVTMLTELLRRLG